MAMRKQKTNQVYLRLLSTYLPKMGFMLLSIILMSVIYIRNNEIISLRVCFLHCLLLRSQIFNVLS